MKIMAICGTGTSTSFMVELNIKKALQELEIVGEVTHGDLATATPESADIFIVAKDLAASAKGLPQNRMIVLSNVIDFLETKNQLGKMFGR